MHGSIAHYDGLSAVQIIISNQWSRVAATVDTLITSYQHLVQFSTDNY